MEESLQLDIVYGLVMLILNLLFINQMHDKADILTHTCHQTIIKRGNNFAEKNTVRFQPDSR